MIASKLLFGSFLALTCTGFQGENQAFHVDEVSSLAQRRLSSPGKRFPAVLMTEASVLAPVHTAVYSIEATAANSIEAAAADSHKFARLEVATHGLYRAIEFYKSSLADRPHLTNAVVAYTITTLGDATAQMMEGGSKLGLLKSFNVKRNIALALTACVYNGLILTSWLFAINGLLPGQQFRVVMEKLAATQTFLQPFVYIPFFFIFHGLLSGRTRAQIRERIASDYFPLLIRLWSLFMPTRLLMFWIVPVRYQVLWDSVVAFIWQITLSLFNAKNGQAAQEAIASGKASGGTAFLLKTCLERADVECASESPLSTEASHADARLPQK